MEENKSTKVDIDVKGEIELPTVDVKQYIGKKTKIESVETHEGNYGYYVKIEGEILEVAGTNDKPIEVKASAILGLQTDSDGVIGWGKDTKMSKFLKSMGVTHFKDLVGKEVIMQSNISKSSGTEFLTFRGV